MIWLNYNPGEWKFFGILYACLSVSYKRVKIQYLRFKISLLRQLTSLLCPPIQ